MENAPPYAGHASETVEAAWQPSTMLSNAQNTTATLDLLMLKTLWPTADLHIPSLCSAPGVNTENQQGTSSGRAMYAAYRQTGPCTWSNTAQKHGTAVTI